MLMSVSMFQFFLSWLLNGIPLNGYSTVCSFCLLFLGNLDCFKFWRYYT